MVAKARPTAVMAWYLGFWALLTVVASVVVFWLCRLPEVAPPDVASVRWVDTAWAAARRGEPLPPAPASARAYRAAGPTFVSLYATGTRRARRVGEGSLAEAVTAALESFTSDAGLRGLPGFQLPSKHAERVQLRVAVTTGSGPLLDTLPWLSLFSIVPLRDAVAVDVDGHSAYVTPDDLLEHRLTDTAVDAPVPDLTFGTSLSKVRALLGAELGLGRPLEAGHRLRRLRIAELSVRHEVSSVDRAQLERAARESVDFVLRHQHGSGRFTYVYDAHTDTEVEGTRYSLARHAGTSFFLARAARQLDSARARAGALRALRYVQQTALGTCGKAERLCVEQRGRVEFGGSALTALACAELLRSGDDAQVRQMLTGLLAFLRAQQREDGEMMHEYSRQQERPVDVQRMYYSGEAALALLTAYEQLRDPRDLEAATRLMAHLTGAGWSFFGARYYYGEEHWTCQAAAKAAAHLQVEPALDFCLRWGRWQERLQYRRGVTPWDVQGAFGVGPLLLPRVTTAASRVEALVPLYQVLLPRRDDLQSTRTLIERGVELLLRARWSPGPEHLFARPSAARGGMPSTQAELRSRVDMVQHAGSAFLSWAEALEGGE